MNVLQELLDPVSVHQFLQSNFTRLPFAMPDKAARYLQDFTEADYAAMVESSRSVLRIVRDGRLVQDNAKVSWAKAQAYHRRGYTLLVRHAERSSAKLQALAEEFAPCSTLQWTSRSTSRRMRARRSGGIMIWRRFSSSEFEVARSIRFVKIR